MEREERRFLFSPPSISVVLGPMFAPSKSEKCLERAEKPTETLATQARTTFSTYLSQLLKSKSYLVNF